MVDPYKVLGLSHAADGVAIKAAYYRLAKIFHPDANGGTRAEAPIRELNQAYEILSDPVRREAYDHLQARRQAASRRRFWIGIATGASTFALTLGSLPLLLSWQRHTFRTESRISVAPRSEHNQWRFSDERPNADGS